MAEHSFARFDGAAAWATLPDQDRGTIGAIALELFAAWHLQGHVWEDGLGERLQRIGDAADQRLVDDLSVACFEAIDHELLEAPDGSPRIPSLIGDVCRSCGCTHFDPCPEGCGWAEPGLCTACADGGGEGMAVADANPALIAAEMARSFADFDRSLDRLDAAAGEISLGISRAHPEGVR